jgi:hypothetical protein
MPKFKLLRMMLCALAGLMVIAAPGCGPKEDATPNAPGYYSGPMKGKTLKPMSDKTGDSSTAPTGK